MSTFDYSRPRATAERLIARFGQTGSFRRKAPGSGGQPWNPATKTGGVATEYPCTFVLLDYTLREKANSDIGMTDKRALISTSGLTIEPSASDELMVDGEAHAIVNIMPLSPGGTVILYEAQVVA